MTGYHILMGKRVPVDKYDTDHLLRMILKLSKRCNKFALKNTKSINIDDGGVWVCRGFISYVKNANGQRWEVSTMDKDVMVVVEKFSTLLDEYEEKYGTKREKLDHKFEQPKSKGWE